MDALQIIKTKKLVPVVVFEKIDDVVPVLTALKNGGLPIAEITFRTAVAAQAIELATQAFPEMLIGAGTVINADQCNRAIQAGVKFIVGPGFNEEVALLCQKQNIPYIPGVVTPSEIMKALAYNVMLVKFFPCSDFGGLKTIKALSAAFPQATFMPTGGITQDNILEYLNFSKIVACGGSFMMKGSPKDIELNTKKIMSFIQNNS